MIHIRLAVVGYFFTAVEAQLSCGNDRCVGFEISEIFGENSLTGITTSCGLPCENPVQLCSDLIDCISTQDPDECQGCAEQIWDELQSSTGECGENLICVNEYVATALEINTCCDGSIFDDLPFDNPFGGDGECFSSMSTAEVENKGTTLVKDIQVGDKVLTMGNEYKAVYTIDHKEPNKQATFVQIHSTAKATPLEITSNHMVFLHGKENPIAASAVKVGDALQTLEDSPSVVTQVSFIERKGIWNPLTEDGTIVVDGIATSTYNMQFRHNDEADFVLAGFKVMSHHDFFHLLMTPYRAICLGLSPSFCEAKHEYNGYNQAGLKILQFFEKQGAVMQELTIFVFLQIVLLLKLISLAMDPLILTGLLVGAGTFYYIKMNKLQGK